MAAPRAVVFIVDDDESIRDALSSLIRSAGLGVQTFTSAQEFLNVPRPETPSCLVLDVRLPELSGLELQKRMTAVDLQIPVIFITAHADVPTAVRAMKAGAIEFLIKPFDDEALLAAVRAAITRDHTAMRQRAELGALHERYASLTPREREVMGLVVLGLLNKQVAAELGTSEVTIKVHRGRVMQKMHADSLAALVRMAAQLDIRVPNAHEL